MIYLHNGIVFQIGQQQTFTDAQGHSHQFAAGDLLKNQDKWAALGITSQADPVYPDPHLFTWVMNPDGTLTVTPRNPAVIAAEDAVIAQALKDDTDATAAKAYAKLTALKAMTPAQVQTWVAANVTTLAQAQDAIATLAIAVSILSRRL